MGGQLCLHNFQGPVGRGSRRSKEPDEPLFWGELQGSKLGEGITILGVKKGPKSEILEGYFFRGTPILDPSPVVGHPQDCGVPPTPLILTPIFGYPGGTPRGPRKYPPPP